MSIAVVIPARDEEALVALALRSVVAAAQRIGGAHVVLVADSCVDDTAEIARGIEGVDVVEIQAGSVGLARAVGFDHAARAGATWVASTDADSVVPLHWLEWQLAMSRTPVGAVLGTVRPSAADLTSAQQAIWSLEHGAGRAVGNVYGANLGVRASAYLSTGGFADLVEHEDVDLIHRMRSAGFLISASGEAEVVTSGRRYGRTPGGFARYVREALAGGTVPARVGADDDFSDREERT